MPIVNGRHYAYSEKGRAAAKKAAKKSGESLRNLKPPPAAKKSGK